MRTNETEHEQMSKQACLEAVLFAAGDPMTAEELAKILELDVLGTQNLLQELSNSLEQRGSGLCIRQAAGGYQLATRPETYQTVERLSQVVERKISAPTMETLSIIAFKQPITKAEIEHIRGVRIDRAVQKLLDMDLIAEVGRKPVIGRPILYGTTPAFLRSFGINSLAELPDLPSTEEVAAGLDHEQLELFEEVQEIQAQRKKEEQAEEQD